MILIDAIYINSGGGKTLLRLLLDNIVKTNLNTFIILIDDNLEKSNLFSNYNFGNNLIVVKKTFFSRFSIYIKLYSKFNTVLCFSSIPPPFFLPKKRVFIYFHNTFLLKSKDKFNFSSIKIYLKKVYFRLFYLDSYSIYVQTVFIQQKLFEYKFINQNNVFVRPIFFDQIVEDSISRTNYKYVYIADDSLHKNHLFLIKAWLILFNSSENFKSCELYLTINFDSSYLTKYYQKDYLLDKNIIFLGEIDNNEAFKILKNAYFLVYVSLNESFGLPLIEASLNGCGIIAPDLPYVSEVIIPTYYYKNDSINDLIAAFKKTNTKYFLNSFIKVENKISHILNDLLHVQK
jgi:hypothetical protein